MRKAIFALALALVMAAGPAWAESVRLMHKAGIDPYLGDRMGMTLYIMKGEPSDAPVCKDKCLETWIPFYDSEAFAGVGLDQSDLGTVVRPDGISQTAYRGALLYYYALDAEPGDIKGHGIDKLWFAASPEGISKPKAK